MSDSWDGLKAQAEAAAAAHARMLELDGGVGKLGVKSPEMFEDLLAWSQLSENEHADTVLTLLRVIEGLTLQRDALINKREELIAKINSFAKAVSS